MGCSPPLCPKKVRLSARAGRSLASADLSSFRVDATVSDIHAQRLRTGLPVRLRLNENDYLEGRVGRILPTVDNGIINLEVELEEKAHPLLRPNMRVDVYIVTERKAKALRLKRGPFINGGEGIHDVFVIRGAVALKNEVRIGIANFDYYEVVEGLLEDDEVIISNMKDYKHMHEVRIK
jgi:HlyD family secretion protein